MKRHHGSNEPHDGWQTGTGRPDAVPRHGGPVPGAAALPHGQQESLKEAVERAGRVFDDEGDRRAISKRSSIGSSSIRERK
jgi:hypothetical protein